MAKAPALAGQCARLAEYLIETNESVSRLAICCLRQNGDVDRPPAYEAMALAIPQKPIPGPPQQPPHPPVDFVKEVSPKIIADCFDNGLWLFVAPLITSIQVTVLREIVLLARLSNWNEQGIPLRPVLSARPRRRVLERLSRRPLAIQLLLKRLSDPNPNINATVIDAFRKCLVNNDPTVFQLFVKGDLLQELGEPPIQQSDAIIKLICQLLPVPASRMHRRKLQEGLYGS